MAELGNLDTYLAGYFSLFFIVAEVGNLLEKITDLMAILIRVVKWMTRCFLIFVRISRTFLFF